jgi:2-dehydro-3-deoxy-D-gluconate 5-dehydrogenase
MSGDVMDLGLAGKTAVVTGGSRGIGRGIVDAFVEEGMTVLAVARASDELDTLGAHPSGQVHTHIADLADPAAAGGVAAHALDLFDNVDVLVNNAGGSRRGPFRELSHDDWAWHLDMNITATAMVTQAFADHFIAKNSGKVINIASTTAIRGVANLVAYCTVKGAILQFTRALAVEWAAHRIQVNAIGPGAFATRSKDRLIQGPADALAERLSRIPDGRMGESEEAGALACYLASAKADHITGALYMIDGAESVEL